MKPWIRLVLAVSLDGRLCSPAEERAQLGGRGDRRVLEDSLAWADATLMGGKTLEVHKSTCLIKTAKLIKQRQLEGLPDQPISIIVSRAKNHSPDWPYFNQPISRWLLSPSNLTSKDPKSRRMINGYDHQLILKNNWSETLLDLYNMDIFKIVLLGGSSLVGSLLEVDLIDELQLTVTPEILGGGKTWVPTKTNTIYQEITNPSNWKLNEVYPMEENELLLRYYRERREPSAFQSKKYIY